MRRKPRFTATGGRQGAVATALVTLVLVVLAPLALAGCGSPPPDANEPNNDFPSATAIAPGQAVDGVIGANDADVFACKAPRPKPTGPFVVTVRTAHPQDLEIEVGASIPGVFEAITWPGWKPVLQGDRVEVAGNLSRGTVLVFLKGKTGTQYTVDVTWE